MARDHFVIISEKWIIINDLHLIYFLNSVTSSVMFCAQFKTFKIKLQCPPLEKGKKRLFICATWSSLKFKNYKILEFTKRYIHHIFLNRYLRPWSSAPNYYCFYSMDISELGSGAVIYDNCGCYFLFSFNSISPLRHMIVFPIWLQLLQGTHSYLSLYENSLQTFFPLRVFHTTGSYTHIFNEYKNI